MPKSVHRSDVVRKPCLELALKFGATWIPITTTEGAPDDLIGYRGWNILTEFKTGKEPLSEKQVLFHRRWNGQPIEVIRTVEEFENMLLLYGRGRRSTRP